MMKDNIVVNFTINRALLYNSIIKIQVEEKINILKINIKDLSKNNIVKIILRIGKLLEREFYLSEVFRYKTKR